METKRQEQDGGVQFFFETETQSGSAKKRS